MAIKIQSTADVSVEGIKVVVYGESGIGKTVLCSTSPYPLIISAEKGLLSLAGKAIPYIEIRNINDVGDAYNFITKSAESSNYKTICIDSISELTETCLTDIKKQLITDSESGKIDARQAYGKVAESIGAMIRRFRDLKHHDVIFTAKMRRVEDEDTGIVKFEPYLPGKVLPFNLPYLVDEVFCMRMRRDNTRYLQTSAERKYIAKDRSVKLSAEEEPDILSIFNKIRSN
jgi:hypothetical protein